VDVATLKEEMTRLGPWLHDVEIAPGLRTAAANGAAEADKMVNATYSPDQMMEGIIGSIYGDEGLAGRSFLDCGCNAAGHSFAAARMGAGRVFAFDARQHWLDQAAFLARFADAPQVELGRITLDELRDARLEPFDVTMFAGLFYHLPDPVAGLKIAADLTRELLIVNTATKPMTHQGLVLSQESATHVLSGIDALAWVPTGPEVMISILAWCGFPHVRIDASWPTGVSRHWWRMQIIAARDEATLARYDAARPDAHPNAPHAQGFATRAKLKLARMLLEASVGLSASAEGRQSGRNRLRR
jgi:SAM-dependent methyltransferase